MKSGEMLWTDGGDTTPDMVNEARIRANMDEIPTKTAFVEQMCEFLEEQGIFREGETEPIDFDRQSMRADAVNFDRQNGALALVVADFVPDVSDEPLVRTRIDSLFKAAENFLLNATSRSFRSKLEESSPEFRFVDLYQKAVAAGRLDTIRIVLVSTRSLGSRTAAADYRREERIEGIPARIRHEIWDAGRYAKAVLSRSGKEDIDIDCTEAIPGGIPCLPADEGDGRRSFLAVLPGAFLADLYGKYSERLLEQNVRTFLQFKGGVNKGIRRTLTVEPAMFFAYNNGITATAEEVETDATGSRILRLRNLQIVNGGQTTASLFNARRDYKATLGAVRVQMKLVTVSPDRIDEVVPRIAEYANTQNAVKAEDFAANHPFQKRMQDLSRRVSAPGAQYDWHWFYERTRGQYNNAIAILPDETKRKQFKKANPQKFEKTELAKVELLWEMKPDVVSRGAQKCFVAFMDEIRPKWENEALADDGAALPEDETNEYSFRESVAKVILFRSLDKRVMKQSWYNGYKANIVSYAIAKFRQTLEDRGLVCDLQAIWNRQEVPEAMMDYLLKIAEVASERLHAVDGNETGNPSEKAKTTAFWQGFRLVRIDPNYDIERDCVKPEKRDRDFAAACNKQRAERSVLNRVAGLGPAWWATLAEWTKAHLSEYFKMHEVLFRKASNPARIGSLGKQDCATLVQLEKYARENGFDA